MFYFAIPGMHSGQDSISKYEWMNSEQNIISSNEWTELKRDSIPPPTTKNDWADLITK